MKQLWAPWRSEYINVKPSHRKRCFLCDALKSADKKNLIIKRGRKCFVIMNKFPYNAGHLLISPNAHKPSLEDLTPNETQELFSLLVEMKKRLVKALKPEGFNIGINLGSVAGAGLLSHIHIHLVPRWGGDTNFMPVLSGTKVISQSLQKLWKELS
ncbi:MAG: HIT domain-containing protein [Planctomycetes bacterium]|nr:HIT domain-containing protein [Planctomycetota bacterium]